MLVMKIIKYTKKNKNTYEITLENKEIITIYDELILKYDLLIIKVNTLALASISDFPNYTSYYLNIMNDLVS